MAIRKFTTPRSSKKKAISPGADASDIFDILCLEDLDVLPPDDEETDDDKRTDTARDTVH